jgi:hypothetical protein
MVWRTGPSRLLSRSAEASTFASAARSLATSDIAR